MSYYILLTLDHSNQVKSLKRHKILSSTMVIMTTVGADTKDREMLCLPLKFVYGWWLNIDVNLVTEDRREIVERYQRECYDVLYDHFAGSMHRATEQAEAEAKLLAEKIDAQKEVKEYQRLIKRIDEKLAKLQEDRLNPQPSLF